MQKIKRLLKNSTILLTLLMWGQTLMAASTINDPCENNPRILYLINRPSAADSPCTVPNKKVVVEAGYAYIDLLHNGKAQSIPEAAFRVGLPLNNELVAILPNYYQQTHPWQNGSNASVLGLKHKFGYTQNWLGTAEALITLPSGSNYFGSAHYGIAVNGIVNYSITDALGLTLMFGFTSQTTSHSEGGNRFNSINPDLLLTYQYNQYALFAEVFGQTNAGYRLGSGYNMDGGLLYAINPNIEFDIEIGQRLTGELGGYQRYYGVGLGVMLG